MKKIAFITVVLLLLSLAWWHRPPAVPVPVSGDGGGPAAANGEKTIRLRFGHNSPTDTALHRAARVFAERIAEKTAGRVRVTVHPAQRLGNDHVMVEMARNGDLDILLTPTAKLSVPVPAMQFADLPFFFPSRRALYEMLDGEPGRLLLDELKTIDLIGVTFWENGFKHFSANRPLTTPEAFAGQKIRIMKSRLILEQFRALGAQPIPIDFHATRQALADGVVDGQENPLAAFVGMGFHEVQSHLTLSEHAYLGYVFSISGKTWRRLPAPIQDLLLESARGLTPFEREETRKREVELLQIAHEAGVTIHRLPEEQRRRFAERLAHIPHRFEMVIGSGLLSLTPLCANVTETPTSL